MMVAQLAKHASMLDYTLQTTCDKSVTIFHCSTINMAFVEYFTEQVPIADECFEGGG